MAVYSVVGCRLSGFTEAHKGLKGEGKFTLFEPVKEGIQINVSVPLCCHGTPSP
jgi:hypothetical protein